MSWFLLEYNFPIRNGFAYAAFLSTPMQSNKEDYKSILYMTGHSSARSPISTSVYLYVTERSQAHQLG